MYRVLKEKSATLPQNDPDIKLHPHNRTFPHPKLNAYGMIAFIKIWSCCSLTCVICTLRRSVL